MRKKILSLIIAAFSGIAFAQETIPMYQQYLFDSEFLFNPAFFGNTDDFVFRATYQKQFSKFDESPNVQSIGMHANVFDRVGAGAYFFRDQNGPISANGIAVGASY
ncbi:MAG: type IX secretion system membrane protein PorP/SprF, partial [Cloacibacterium sp.]|nr:type IX secretion system membrane protein PorP/SprF [Cloacibacterium sp.]